ncbi:hypothetical protein JD844_001243 [Phrynosoma platyrhinos]|uniref:Uncharacterized protein n=1 Tax=Phrynosoma platyrhinos TaxID=52577 RepID=A0ABQ7T9B8_PHRPL|nr:hypothetical protein JD844_001243 [Phrynosoma platyrhinos]
MYKLNKPNHSNCTGEERLRNLPGTVFEMGMSGQSYSIYNAVYAVAHALHAADSLRAKRKAMGPENSWKPMDIEPWQLCSFLRYIRFNNSAGEEVFFDENGDLASGFDVISLVTFSNQSFQKVRVGGIYPQASAGKRFTMNGSSIVWNHKFKKVPPRSRCVENCQPGYSKIVQQGNYVCCYDCVQCADGRISVHIDASECTQCPEDQYPNGKRDQCLSKRITYLSYTEHLGAILASSALVFSAITIMAWESVLHSSADSLWYHLRNCNFLYFGQDNHCGAGLHCHKARQQDEEVSWEEAGHISPYSLLSDSSCDLFCVAGNFPTIPRHADPIG